MRIRRGTRDACVSVGASSRRPRACTARWERREGTSPGEGARGGCSRADGGDDGEGRATRRKLRRCRPRPRDSPPDRRTRARRVGRETARRRPSARGRVAWLAPDAREGRVTRGSPEGRCVVDARGVLVKLLQICQVEPIAINCADAVRPTAPSSPASQEGVESREDWASSPPGRVTRTRGAGPTRRFATDVSNRSVDATGRAARVVRSRVLGPRRSWTGRISSPHKLG